MLQSTSSSESDSYGTLQIIKFFDYDQNGVRSPDEPGLAAVRFLIEGHVLYDERTKDRDLVITTLTDSDGEATIRLPSGNYRVSEELIWGWETTTSPMVVVTINRNENIIVMFGNYQRIVIKNDEVVAKIISGEPADYNNVIIEGDILIENQTIKYPLNITNSEIKGNLTFNNSKFLNGINFDNNTFYGFVSFKNTISERNSTITNSTFLRYAALPDSNIRIYNQPTYGEAKKVEMDNSDKINRWTRTIAINIAIFTSVFIFFNFRLWAYVKRAIIKLKELWKRFYYHLFYRRR